MKPHIVMDMIERLTIEEFCAKYGTAVVVKERAHVPEGESDRYYATIRRVHITDGEFCRSPFANGSTPDEAIAGLPALYSNKTLLIDGMGETPERLGPFVFTE